MGLSQKMSSRFDKSRKAFAPKTPGSTTGVLQRVCACGQHTTAGAQCEDCKKKAMTLERHSTGVAVSDEVPSIVNDVLQSPGLPLDRKARSAMESRLGHDLSAVRVHKDSKASDSARAVHARAYTVGRDIVFAEGEYNPGSRAGDHLLAHELTHVVQQGTPKVSGRAERVGRPDSPEEKIAEAGASHAFPHASTTHSVGNHGSSTTLHRDPDIDSVDWKTGVAMAAKAATDAKTKAKAESYYKALVVRAAGKVSVPTPLKEKKPTTSDINWSWAAKRDYSATTDPNKVDAAPDEYWKWLSFNSSAIHDEEAFTVSIIFHELDHAAHARTLYDSWKKSTAKDKGKWTDFYQDHYAKWTEAPIKLEKPGMMAVLTGLPDKIQPSAIEFRAYANQFVNFFHKFSIDKQSYMAETIVLFYPLKTQKVEEKISDPSLDLAQSRQKILDYFKSPPVKDTSQQEIIKVRMSTEFKGALLNRPAADQAKIRSDFKDIFEYEFDSDARKDARRNYKPEGL
jgi:Domain of unknown function (DUF4157)